MVENKGTVALVGSTPTNVLASIDLVNNRDAAMIIFKDIVASGKMNVTTTAEVMAMYIKSQELGIPFMTASDHMHMVNGKAGVDIHILRAKLLKAGCILWELEHDYSPLYEYKDNTGALIGTHFTDDELLEMYELPKGSTPAELKADATRITSIGNTPVFKVPSYIQLTPEFLIEYGRFSTADMVTASLHCKRNGEISWDSPHIKYERVMQEHRAWTFGGRKIGADIILGLYETKEMYDMTNTNYDVDDQGTATIINDESE